MLSSVLCLKLLYEKNKKEKNINKTVLENTHPHVKRSNIVNNMSIII